LQMRSKKPLVVSVVGARPQFIKLAPLAKRLSKRFDHVIVHTGQHYDRMMSDIFFRQLDIPKPGYNLGVGSGNHGLMTGRIMARLEKLLADMKPDLVLVYGDTNSTLGGALTAAKLRIPLGHVEAGLRSYRMDMPEEINRRLADHVSQLLFCPTAQSIRNLKAEGITKGIVRSGDLMYELIATGRKRITRNTRVLKMHHLAAKEFLLMTMHRAENVDRKENLEKIADILLALNDPVIFPVHPRTLKNLRKYRLLAPLKKSPGISLIEPVSYLDSLSLIYHAKAVLTDSGGVQKESVFLGTSCLTLRDETEWVETLKQGNRLTGLSSRRILSALRALKPPARQSSYTVKGRAPSEIITSSLADYFRRR
jgi:UDP-N-acetylglucosamine 2-epimerase